MKKLKKNSKIEIIWDVNPYDYNLEEVKNIISKASKKYDIPKEYIKVVPNFLSLDKDGNTISLTKDIVCDIQKPEFQKSLFKEYLQISGITDYDFNIINDIDNAINDKINFDNFNDRKKFSLKWIKWSNFLSYGENNFFDFTNLNGLVLLHGEAPYENQSGKTSFAIDLTHFLFYGKTTKTDKLEQIFNINIPEATEVYVEGCISIDGDDYIIKRILTRPKLEKRTVKSKVSQKIEYFKVVNGILNPLEEYNDEIEEENGQTVKETNKIIKQAVGSEQDYDLMICATSSNLDDLITMKETDRGKLLSRWIGLTPLENKDVLARQTFNQDIKTHLISNNYNKENLLTEIETLQEQIKTLKEKEVYLDKRNKLIEKEINDLMISYKTELSLKTNIDSNLSKLDVNTIEKRINEIITEGKKKRKELNDITSNLDKFDDIKFDIELYKKVQDEKLKCVETITTLNTQLKFNKNSISNLEKGEYCPTCGRKYDNVDNSALIKKIHDDNLIIENEIKKFHEIQLKVNKTLEELDELQAKDKEKNKLTVRKSALELNLERLTNEYYEKINLRNDYKKNLEAIKKNNEIDISIRNLSVTLKIKQEEKENNIKTWTEYIATIKRYDDEIAKKKLLIQEIEKELKLVKNWKIYLDMVGKNGIAKMVLRRALPIINADLSNMLSDICDFTVRIEITDKQDVIFYIVRDGKVSNLDSGSGYETTCSALALRTVLARISSIARINCLILDEILGRVAASNYDNMKKLYDKIINDYDFIIQVTHIEDVKDWHNKILSVTKVKGISSIHIEK